MEAPHVRFTLLGIAEEVGYSQNSDQGACLFKMKFTIVLLHSDIEPIITVYKETMLLKNETCVHCFFFEFYDLIYSL